MLDDDQVHVGDSVYDIVMQATGIVEDVRPDGGFTVRIGSKRMVYQLDGYYMQTKRVYWRNPVIMIPRKKDKRRQDLIIALADTVDIFFGKEGI